MQTDEAALNRLCDNINDMLMRKNWRDRLYEAREQMPKSPDGDMPMPLADVILQAHSSQVLEAINHVHQLARAGQLRSAMEEAFQAIAYAPTYAVLPGVIACRRSHGGSIKNIRWLPRHIACAVEAHSRDKILVGDQLRRDIVGGRTKSLTSLFTRQVNEAN